jgi:VWFA-related protein
VGRRRAALAAWFVPALAWATGSAGAAEQPLVEFLRPRAGSTAVGATEIELRVSVPEGARVARLELRADGEPVAVLAAPPWKTTWNAGDGSRAHALEARLVLADGRESRAVMRTSALHIDLVESVELVNLYLVVRDRKGEYVTDLRQEDLRVFEDGVSQTVSRFTAAHKPLRAGLVLDCSHSMRAGERLDKAKEAALDFLQVLQEGDEGLVVQFSDDVRVAQELTSDTRLLARAIESAVPIGGTALYDAIWRTARLLDAFEGRRVMVLLSDGRDESSNGFEPGSLHTLEEAMDQALRAEVIVFPVGLGRNLDREYVRRWGDLAGRSNVDPETSVAALLERLASTTGGRSILLASAGRLRQAFAAIVADLRHQYSVAYASTNRVHDGKWRTIEVRIPGREVEAITRKGYYAPGGAAAAARR